jgi:hypothetical protein
MSPITSATSSSTALPVPAVFAASRGAAPAAPSKPRDAKVPQRVGKSASATFLRFQIPCFHSTGQSQAPAATAPCCPNQGIGLRRNEQPGMMSPRRLPGFDSLLRFSRVLRDTLEAVTDNLIWITLLVKLGVVASVASVLARVSTFRRLFFADSADHGKPWPCWRSSWCRSRWACGCVSGSQLSGRRHLL